MKIYIAAPYEMRRKACSIASWLESQGIEVTSRWLAGEVGEQSAWAQNDLDDIDRADLLLALNPEEYRNKGTGGRHGEFLYAHARGKQLVLVGVRTNIFHHLDCVRVIERIEDL